MFDEGAVTVIHELVGAGSYIIVNDTNLKYIQSVAMQQSGVASVSEIYCGTDVVARNYGKDFPAVLMQYRCTDIIQVSKTGNDSSTFIITYTTRDLSQLRVSTSSGQLVEFGNQTAIAMQGLSFILWTGFALLLLMQSIMFGTWIFKKRV
jgi:hypothetical protein